MSPFTIIALVFIALVLVGIIWLIRRATVDPKNPYPDRSGFTEVWDRSTISEKHKLIKSIKISTAGNDSPIEVHVLRAQRKYYFLSSKANAIDIFQKLYAQNRNISYFTYSRALQVAQKNDNIINMSDKELLLMTKDMPGKTFESRLFNFMTLFEFKELGYFSVDTKQHNSERMLRSDIIIFRDDPMDLSRIAHEAELRTSYIDRNLKQNYVSRAMPVFVGERTKKQ